MKERHIRVARTARYYTLGSAGPHLREIWIVCHGIRQLARRFLPRFAELDDGTRLIVAPEGLSRSYLHGPESRPDKPIPIGATWMTREDRENEITDYVEFLDAVLDEVTGGLGETAGQEPGQAAGEEPSQAAGQEPGQEAGQEPGQEAGEESDRESREKHAPLTVLGFSQGAHTVCRWLAAGDMPVARIILWGAYLPEDFDLARGPERLRSAELILVHGLLDHFISEEAHVAQEARLEELGIPFKTITHAGGHELDQAVLREIAGLAG